MNKNEPNLSNLSQGSVKRDHGTRNIQGPVGITPRPSQVICGDIGMHIDRHGVWFYHGTPIPRKELVKLFSTVLRRDEAGDHWLITPAEMARVDVEDAPYLAVEMFTDGTGDEQIIRFRTNIDGEFTLSDDHPLRVENAPETGEPAPYLALDHGLEAKLNRAVFYQLVDQGVEQRVEEEHIFGVWSCGHFYPIGKWPADEAA
ncbi:MAG: DUF1285 domain-containing protein [Rhodospirillaceae bacterium]|mgnify:FL=1|nr:DUF1285 domain-containing protein [Rhodospirillaceae bacterium]MBT5513060.1 DUF1285 domain-containing protein [Rhodospirillaceae bacterium]MBT6084244.1 DUF1285 domain-containing protein [Rhodospirillaceae bacterium]